MTTDPRVPLGVYVVYFIVAIFMSVIIILAASTPGCGRRSCEPDECKLTRNAAGNVIEQTCPSDCEP